jgi:hypothetical protein
MDEGRLTNAAADVAIMRKDESGRPRVAERRSDRWSNPAGRLREVVETTTRRVKDMVRGEAGQGGRLESEAPAHGDEVDLPIDELMREVDAESERMVARLEQKASETVRQSASTDDDRRRLDEILSAMQQEADDLAAHADLVLEDAIGWMARAESAVRTNDDNAAKEYLDKYQEAVLVAEGLQADAQAAREAVAAYRAAVRNRVAE